MQKKFQHISEYSVKPGERSLIIDAFTWLWITEGVQGQLEREHEVLEAEDSFRVAGPSARSIGYREIFKPLQGKASRPRVVLTKGIAGIGKTVCVHKLIYDWASGCALQEFDFVFTFPFRELSILPEHNCSLVQLVRQFYPYMDRLDEILRNESVSSLFIFDGLDESCLSLDFTSCPEYHEPTETIPMASLVMNLIKGDLLPSAAVWITTRPVAMSQIPTNHIDRVTEIQGFKDDTKEEYFRRKIVDPSIAEKIITHIKKQKTLFIMCHIPAFCWLLATAFEHSLQFSMETFSSDVPQTLTEVYTKFLIVMVMYQHRRVHGIQTTDDVRRVLEASRDTILSLGKLAFSHLRAQKIIFYEADIASYGIDMSTVCSSVCREIVIEDTNMLYQKAYSFVHLTVQEYFAALYVFMSFWNKKTNPLTNSKVHLLPKFVLSFYDICKTACQDAIKSPNGHLDLFLRFLCGIGTERNQKLLQGLFKNVLDNRSAMTKVMTFIKKMLNKSISPDRRLNLLHCLSEMGDTSAVDEVRSTLASGALSLQTLSPAQTSALDFILQTSEQDLKEFNISQYSNSSECLARLLPVAKLHRKIKLEENLLTEESKNSISSLLCSTRSRVKELRLTVGSIQTASPLISGFLPPPTCTSLPLSFISCGYHSAMSASLKDKPPIKYILQFSDPCKPIIKLLCPILMNPNCRLETLRVHLHNLSKDCCKDLTSVLGRSEMLVELDLTKNELKDSGVKELSATLKDAHCKLTVLRLNSSGLSDACCKDLPFPESLIELDLGKNKIGDAGVNRLSASMKSPTCKIQKLIVSSNKLSKDCCGDLVSVLRGCETLEELDLTMNNLGDSGVKQLCAGLKDPRCKLTVLKLSCNGLTNDCCGDLASAIYSSQFLTELDLSWNNLTDSGAKLFSSALQDQNCKLQKLKLSCSGLTDDCCGDLASAICSSQFLIDLDLSCNYLTDSGVKLLSSALQDQNCKLQKLKLSCNKLTDDCCGDLASAICSSQFLTDLDLSCNYLRYSGEKLLSSALQNQNCKLQKLK
uniref:Si:ch211-114l13.13 n=1 Tax=Latimeria chalumnae TaxID=7897 RepID=H2ZWW7_LATCH